jgi:hypothetical protein
MNPKPIALAFAALLLGSPMATAKEQGRWCAISDDGSGNCSFVSVARCLATVSKSGGYCMREEQMDNRPRGVDDNSSTQASRAPKNQGQDRDLPIDIHICRGC